MGRSELVIDSHAYSSHIRCWNPTCKLLFSVIVLLMCLVLDNPYVSMATITSMGLFTVKLGGIGLRDYLSLLKIPLTFILLGTLAIGFEFSSYPLGDYNIYVLFGYIWTSADKISDMVFLILKVFGSISAVQMVTLSTPSAEIIHVLKKLHMPKPLLDLMNLIYRYIFILTDLHGQMKNSAQSRLGYCDFKTSIRTFGNMASNLLVTSIKKSNDYYDAMESRCYDGEIAFFQEDKVVEISQVLWSLLVLVWIITIWYLSVWKF